MHITNLIKVLMDEYLKHGDMKVILSRDSEGNSFTDTFVAQVEHAHFDIRNLVEVVHEDDICEYEQHELSRVLVLWP